MMYIDHSKPVLLLDLSAAVDKVDQGQGSVLGSLIFIMCTCHLGMTSGCVYPVSPLS